LAAWVQAIGSILAIVAAFAIGNHQTRVQVKLARIAAANGDVQSAETMTYLTGAALRAVQQGRGRLDQREKVQEAAEGKFSSMYRELEAFERVLSDIPAYRVSPKVLRQALIIASNIRQFRLKVAMALEHHRKMDADEFAAFFSMMEAIESALKQSEEEATKMCDECRTVVRELEGV
jgi:hypothetical protein